MTENFQKPDQFLPIFKSLNSFKHFFLSFFSLTDSGSESGSHKSIRDKRQSGPSDGKPTRVRTVLNEKQLHTLR